MKKIWIFFRLRVLQFGYDKTALFFCYILPLLMLIGIGIPMNSDTTVIKLYYSDQNSDLSESIVSEIKKYDFIQLIKTDQKQVQILSDTNKQHEDIFLNITSDEFKDTISPEKISEKNNIQLHLYYNAYDKETKIYVNAIENIISHALNSDKDIAIFKHEKQNRQEAYIFTLLPGLIGMTILIISINGFGFVLVEENIAGIFKKLKTIDFSPTSFLTGLVISRLAVCIMISFLLFLCSVFLFNLEYKINFFLLLIVVIIGSLSLLGIGLVFGVLSKTTLAFNGIANFFQIPLIIFSGVFFSIDLFPNWLQFISKLLPLTHFNIALRKIFFESLGFHNIMDISIQLLVLIVWGLVTLIIGRISFKW